MRDDLRITERDLPAAGEVNITEDSHVFIRRHRVPIDPGPAKIIGQSWEYLDCQRIEFARPSGVADVQLMHAKRSGDLIRGGNLFAVEPNVGAKIDAIEMQPNILAAVTCRQTKFSSIPPGNAERAVFGHRTQREVCADWIV